MRRILLIALVCAAGAGAGLGQGPPPLQGVAGSKRPSLGGGADTNSWEAYFDYAVKRLRSDPREAERAFWWSSRLDPTRAEPLYGRWVAYWMRFPGWFEEYLRERPEVLAAPSVIQADSLREQAMFRNPLVHQTLILLLFDRLPGTWGTDRYTLAWLAYGAGKFDAAAEGFARLVRDEPVKHYRARYELALCLTALRRYDSASVEITALLAEMRRRDEKHLAYWYQSKELLEYSVGLLQLARGDVPSARAALQRALVENLAFYPAHTVLGDLALDDRDPTAAVREFAQAVDLAPADGVVRFNYGAALASAGRFEEAELPLRTSTELEPWYASPFFALGAVLETRGQAQPALEQYRAFVQRAPRTAPELSQALAQIEALSAARSETPAPRPP